MKRRRNLVNWFRDAEAAWAWGFILLLLAGFGGAYLYNVNITMTEGFRILELREYEKALEKHNQLLEEAIALEQQPARINARLRATQAQFSPSQTGAPADLTVVIPADDPIEPPETAEIIQMPPTVGELLLNALIRDFQQFTGAADG